MPDLDSTLLARVNAADPAQILREDLEDALKEYGELDLLIELIQNALDSIDERRYRVICEMAGKDYSDVGTIDSWNQAVLEALMVEHDAYSRCETMVEKATFYRKASDDTLRRHEWFEILGRHFGADATTLSTAAASLNSLLRVTVRAGQPHWIEIEDNGVGIADIPNIFRHKTSGKRHTRNRPRRFGVRGSHGWGLTAVLGLSDRVEILSRVDGDAPKAYAFSDYASFVQGAVSSPRNESIDLTVSGCELSERLRSSSSSGTHIRVRVAGRENTSVLGHALAHFSHEKFENLLRLYTPIGQVNDYLLHPAYHNVRKSDVVVELSTYVGGDHPRRSTVPFDFFRLSGRQRPSQLDFYQYIDAGSPRNKSVHTIHRTRRGANIYLSAADVQAADLVHQLEDDLRAGGALPEFIDELERTSGDVPRGFQLALSGGMRSEHLARAPRSTGAAYRGIILSETAQPTLGRKYVVDQRTAIAKAAAEHEVVYDAIRRAVLPSSEPPPATPAALKWKREFFNSTVSDLKNQPPKSSDVHIWCGRESLEARVMLGFGELLARGYIGDMRILRAHLQDVYDFAFLYRAKMEAGSYPSMPLAETLKDGGYLEIDRRGYLRRYGIGEFKEKGESILGDFDPKNPRKSPNTPDLLVCWSFSKEEVEGYPWGVLDATPENSEFQGQTHLWQPNRGEVPRERGLPVISISALLDRLLQAQDIHAGPDWPETLPDVYY
ncbi:ATP-binding protein [Streptomyces longwoodensis]|uniref:ATP-binding protein n=1 Tax=Streptomyces longwoodensis TaxID=68231 RepID=UPI0033D3DF1C